MKYEWARETHTVCCTSNERSGLVWFKTGIWKLRGMRKGAEKGRFPVCGQQEYALHVLLNSSETRKLNEQFLVESELL
jgi:hypothetical protein